MKLGKITNGQITLVECEGGLEVNGTRTEMQLYEEGYKKSCLTPKENDTDVEEWAEYPNCIVQTWKGEEQPSEEQHKEEDMEE